MGYGTAMAKAGFDPAHPLAKRPISRLRAFHRVVAKHSNGGFPTLVMNDGAAAYSNVESVRSDKVWRFIERCWALYSEATTTDLRSGGVGLRGVIAVGLRAKGSSRGIRAQEDEHLRIIEDLDAGMIDKTAALARARRVRRVFDVVPPLQANFAFARAYEAEREGSKAGLPGPNLYLDTLVFRDGIPEWIRAAPSVDWSIDRLRLSATFVALQEIGGVSDEEAQGALRTGRELMLHLCYDASAPLFE